MRNKRKKEKKRVVEADLPVFVNWRPLRLPVSASNCRALFSNSPPSETSDCSSSFQNKRKSEKKRFELRKEKREKKNETPPHPHAALVVDDVFIVVVVAAVVSSSWSLASPTQASRAASSAACCSGVTKASGLEMVNVAPETNGEACAEEEGSADMVVEEARRVDGVGLDAAEHSTASTSSSSASSTSRCGAEACRLSMAVCSLVRGGERGRDAKTRAPIPAAEKLNAGGRENGETEKKMNSSMVGLFDLLAPFFFFLHVANR